MKLKTLYELAVKKGLSEDLRSKKLIEEGLKKVKAEYSKTKGIDRDGFDTERLKHPYDDTRILNGSSKAEIKNVMVGIDIGVSELLLADRLREKGIAVDVVISHHPEGRAFAHLHKVMSIQPGVWQKYGFTDEIAQGIMKNRMQEVERRVAPSNHTRIIDAAKLLGIPFMCIHTVADNCVANFLQKLFDRRKPKKLKDILTLLKQIPEYKIAVKEGLGPSILVGKETSNAGKIFVDMTGGTSGPDRLYARMSQSGVKTFVGMHCKESGYKIAKSEFLNYVIAGHIPSDSVGVNIMFDAVEKKERLNFIECSGFRRIRRK